MASFSGPKLSNRIADDVPDIQAVLSSLAKLTPDSGNTDYPIGTKRVAETTNGYEFQQYNGTGWVTLEKWNINAQKVDGYSASTGTTASTIPVRGTDGKISGDITGNAATASKAAALSATNPIATGGTGATTAAQARANLGTPPKSHASSSSDFGAGSSTQYGHTKTHDEPDATLTAATGHAFSPAGAASMKTELEEQIEEVETGASSQLSSLDSSLRALIAQEVAKCLKLTGGTMTGPLYADNTAIVGRYENGRLGFASSSGKAATLNLFGRYLAGDYAGAAELIAENDDNRSTFVLFPDGRCNVNGNAVLTSAGGTMNGTLFNVHLIRNNLSGQAVFGGGTTLNNGACIVAYGQSCTEGYGYGQLLLRGADKGTVCDLIVHPHNGVLINGQRVHTLAASWTSGANWYRKYSDGWIEQGGYVAKSTVPHAYVGYHLPFANTNYFFTSSATPGSTDASGGDGHQNRSTTGCTILHTAFYHNGAGAFWYACGY